MLKGYRTFMLAGLLVLLMSTVLVIPTHTEPANQEKVIQSPRIAPMIKSLPQASDSGTEIAVSAQCELQVLHAGGFATAFGLGGGMWMVAQQVVAHPENLVVMIRVQVSDEQPWGGAPEDNEGTEPGNPDLRVNIWNETTDNYGSLTPGTVIWSVLIPGDSVIVWPNWTEVIVPELYLESNFWVGYELVTDDIDSIDGTNEWYNTNMDLGPYDVNSGAWVFYESWGEWIHTNLFGGIDFNNWLIEVEFCTHCIDSDGDGYGDAGFIENECPPDNCDLIFNPEQEDSDGDGVGDACDNCAVKSNVDQTDIDGDSIGNVCDNCPLIANPDQVNSDGDIRGDACDNCPTVDNPDHVDHDNDGVGNACDICPGFDDRIDEDFDSIPDCIDNCPSVANPGQEDNDSFGLGNACCCGSFTVGYAGNVNCDTFGKRNLADITELIDNVYISKLPLCCPANGNINGDAEAKINLADITNLIDHVYISKDETAVCE